MENKIPSGTLIFELVDQKDSGFVMDGTERSNNPVRINWSETCSIPAESKRPVFEVNAKGEMVVSHYENIRYIPGEPTLSVEEQQKKNLHVPKRNRITFEKNMLTVPDAPEHKTFREFLWHNIWCENTPGRPSSVDPIYRLVEIKKKAEAFNEFEGVMAQAVARAYSLSKKQGGEFVYDKEKIDSYCRLLGLYKGESPSESLTSIINYAKAKPLDFLELVEEFESTLATEVEQALKLKVITIKDNVAMFTESESIVKTFGSEKLTKVQQVNEIADFLKTSEGAGVLTEMRARVEVEKQNQLKNK